MVEGEFALPSMVEKFGPQYKDFVPEEVNPIPPVEPSQHDPEARTATEAKVSIEWAAEQS